MVLRSSETSCRVGRRNMRVTVIWSVALTIDPQSTSSRQSSGHCIGVHIQSPIDRHLSDTTMAGTAAVSQLNVYPVKACRGISCSSVYVSPIGALQGASGARAIRHTCCRQALAVAHHPPVGMALQAWRWTGSGSSSAMRVSWTSCG